MSEGGHVPPEQIRFTVVARLAPQQKREGEKTPMAWRFRAKMGFSPDELPKTEGKP
jgi:hypothetical protein